MHFLLITALTMVLMLVVPPASAQRQPVKGVVYEQETPLRVGEVVIQNLTGNTRAKTNYMGEFNISASTGDTLLLSKPGYADYKLAVRSQKVLVIQLIKLRTLSEVVITAPSKKEELDEVKEDFRRRGSFYHGKPPLLAYVFKPLTALYELLGKTPRQARRFHRYYENELEQTEVDRRFNKALVLSITGLQEKDLVNFMAIYRPEYEKLRGWNDYDLRSYIIRCLKAFNDNGRPEGLPDLRKIAIPGH